MNCGKIILVLRVILRVSPFVNDNDWLIWSDWGQTCSLEDENGTPLYNTPRALVILYSDPNGQVRAVLILQIMIFQMMRITPLRMHFRSKSMAMI